MDQVLLVSTPLGASMVEAMLTCGLLDSVGIGRRVVVTSVQVPVPEAEAPATSWPEVRSLGALADDVMSWNEFIYPLHPSQWLPGRDAATVLEPVLRGIWRLEQPTTEVVIDSLASRAAMALARILSEARVVAYQSGIECYVAVPEELAADVARRLDAVLPLDLLPDVTPSVAADLPVQVHRVDPASVRSIVERQRGPEQDEAPGGDGLTALVLSPPAPATDTDTSSNHLLATIEDLPPSIDGVLLQPTLFRSHMFYSALARPSTRSLHLVQDRSPTATVALMTPDLVLGDDLSLLLALRRMFDCPVAMLSPSDHGQLAANFGLRPMVPLDAKGHRVDIGAPQSEGLTGLLSRLRQGRRRPR